MKKLTPCVYQLLLTKLGRPTKFLLNPRSQLLLVAEEQRESWV